MDADPPQYSRSSTAYCRHSSSARRSTRPPTEHVYQLTNAKSWPWLTLKLMSNAPSSSYLPAFYRGEEIAGCVSERQSLQSILARMTSSATDVFNFLQASEVLWPQLATSEVSASRVRGLKLVGEHIWPFCLRFPEQCHLRSPNGPTESYPLPASFSERMARVHIQYQVVVTVCRGNFDLGSVVGYCPVIRPVAPSIARQIAYMENSPLIGPEGDPEGWRCLEALRVHRSVFSTLTVEATCTLALAKPLCYTRGSVIPCLMTIETTDPQALDLLSAPRSPLVRLLRRISTQEATAGSVGAKKLPGLAYESTVQKVVTTAVWWAEHARDPRSPHQRTLHGEIHLSSALKPSCLLGKFELSVSSPMSIFAPHAGYPGHAQYSVAVYPPRAVAFLPDGGAEAVLQQEPVVVGTVYAAGPRPRINSPPGYGDASSTGQTSEFRLFR
ncbi:hypothetical protein BV20DRAFT_951982 [Pilatotrama ljubarskyi]|nr:hypothetical protein BV20DRAFT_951982 [Pilatotrama ljubarskyi]